MFREQISLVSTLRISLDGITSFEMIRWLNVTYNSMELQIWIGFVVHIHTYIIYMYIYIYWHISDLIWISYGSHLNNPMPIKHMTNKRFKHQNEMSWILCTSNLLIARNSNIWIYSMCCWVRSKWQLQSDETKRNEKKRR